MTLFRHKSAQAETEPTVNPNPDHFLDFLEVNQGSINEYSRQYSLVGEAILELNNDEDIKEKITSVFEDYGTALVRRDGKIVELETAAETLLANISVYYVYSAKQFLAFNPKIGIRDTLKLARSFATGIEFIDTTTSTLSGDRRYNGYLLDIFSGLSDAENFRRFTASNYADAVMTDLEILPETFAFYAGKTKTDDPSHQFLARDFRDIAAADALDTQGIILPTISRLGDTPDLFLNEYVDGIEDGTIDSRLSAMARFVLGYNSISGLPTVSEAEVLRATRSIWSEIDSESENAFVSYASRKSKEYLRIFRSEVGIDSAGRRRGIRMPSGKQEVELAVGTLKIFVTNLSHRNRSKAAKTAKNFMFAETFMDEARDGGTEALPVHTTAKLNGSNSYVSTDPESGKSIKSLIEEYAGSNPALKSDVERMIREISINPFCDGYKAVVVKSAINTTIDNRRVKVLEFSPLDRSFSLKSGKEGKRTRITYSVGDEGVHILHILHHDDFDRMYKLS